MVFGSNKSAEIIVKSLYEKKRFSASLYTKTWDFALPTHFGQERHQKTFYFLFQATISFSLINFGNAFPSLFMHHESSSVASLHESVKSIEKLPKCSKTLHVWTQSPIVHFVALIPQHSVVWGGGETFMKTRHVIYKSSKKFVWICH